jgi:hypothetical protein
MAVFWLALAFLAGLVCGVFSVALTAHRGRARLKRRYWERGYQAACVNEGLRHLRRVE